MVFNRAETIIVIDDSVLNTQLLHQFLTESGFNVVVAQDGYSGIEKVQQVQPDLILLDVMMPGIDGFEICRRLKSSQKARDIPVIFMTSLSDTLDKLKGLAVGAVDYITKPFQQEEVLARINVHLKLRNITRQLEEQNQRLQGEIRERKLAEKALRLSEQKFNSAFRSSPEPIILSTLNEGRVIEVNDSFCQFTGHDMERLLGKKITEIDFWLDREDYGKIIETLCQQKQVRNIELTLHNAHRQIRTVLFSAEILDCVGEELVLCIYTDITERKRAEIQLQELNLALEEANKNLQQLATIDCLTQVANRLSFDSCLEKEWKRLAREKQPLSMILCDVDYFKRYNDYYGHQVGDNCLRQVAQAIAKAARRPADLVARYGGEEFAVILPNTSEQEAVNVAEKIRFFIKELYIPHVRSEIANYITMSLGVSSMIPSHLYTADALISAADQALYEAKQQGRDRLCVKKIDIMRVS